MADAHTLCGGLRAITRTLAIGKRCDRFPTPLPPGIFRAAMLLPRLTAATARVGTAVTRPFSTTTTQRMTGSLFIIRYVLSLLSLLSLIPLLLPLPALPAPLSPRALPLPPTPVPSMFSPVSHRGSPELELREHHCTRADIRVSELLHYERLLQREAGCGRSE